MPPTIEELCILWPVLRHTGMRQLVLFGTAIYEFHVPGIECPRHEEGAQKWSTMGARFFGEVPGQWRKSLEGWRGVPSDTYHVRIEEYERVFGQRRPTGEDPGGFPVTPGASAGNVRLFFPSEPLNDVIWPKWGASLFVSERVLDLFERRDVRSVRYHPVADARVVGEAPFGKLVKRWGWIRERFRENVSPDAGRPAQKRFYEVEAIGKPGDCGLRWRLMCSNCGYTRHDVRRARTSGSVGGFPRQDFFPIRCLGWPVCTKRVVDLLHRAEMRFFDVEPVSDLIASYIKDEADLGRE